MKTIKIKNWFIEKNEKFSESEKIAMNEGYQLKCVEMREKAIKFIIHTDYGKIFAWIPKSCLEIDIDVDLKEGADYL